MPTVFFDSNILIYSFDVKYPQKQEIAYGLIADAVLRGNGYTSIQGLGELFVNLVKKLRMPADVAQVHVEAMMRMNLIHSEASDVSAAMELHRLHQLSYWDAMIVQTAARAGVATLYSEDMQHGGTIRGVRIVNPFL
jgi:predicted nucleic acid-binding protein